jgi:hypothetical protein
MVTLVTDLSSPFIRGERIDTATSTSRATVIDGKPSGFA